MKKKTAVLSMIILLLAAMAYILMSYHIIDFKFYPKKAETLDLRGKEITVEHYQRLQEKLPECDITWDVPLQGTTYPSDSRELAVTDLEETMHQLPFFPALESLDLKVCEDLSALAALRETAPHLGLRFEITQDGKTCDQDSKELTLTSFGDRELALLPAMENLRTVTVAEGADAAHLSALKAHCQESGIELRLLLNRKTLTEADKELTVENVTEPQANLLRLASWLETLHLTEPEAEAETVLALAEELKDTEVTWEKTILGLTFGNDATEIDLTPVIALAEGEAPGTKTAYQYALECGVLGDREKIPSCGRMSSNRLLPSKFEQTEELLEETADIMSYFPKAEKLVMCGAWLNDDTMAAYREEHRQDYKTVWSVRCGVLALRTDASFFMPTKYRIAYDSFTDLDTYNLKYCEDLIAIDLGHYEIANLDFVEHIPNLKYLDVTLTNVKDLSPVSSCKNLIYLTTAYARRIRDYSPLQGCTALQDLNIRGVTGDITPLLEMDWLKNLWIYDASEEEYQRAVEALPNTNIGYHGSSVSTWRRLPNYYAFRDALLMFYMN